MADLLEFAIGLLEKGGAAAGVGGGFISARVFNRVQKGLTDAAAALENARSAQKAADNALTAVESLKSELGALQQSQRRFEVEIKKALRGSHTGLDDARSANLENRLTAIETRTSSIEDDFDAKAKSDQQSWEAIQRAVGRIEGSMQGLLQSPRDSRS